MNEEELDGKAVRLVAAWNTKESDVDQTFRSYFSKKLTWIFFKESMDKLIPVVYMIGVLLLVLPAFLQSNSKLKQLLTNFTIWIIVVLIILTLIYIFKN